FIGLFALFVIVSSVGLVAKFFTKKVKEAPATMEYTRPTVDEAKLTEEELKKLEEAEQQVIKDLEGNVEGQTE
ncbi:hypothetical protein KAH94_04775, partial [bacterium]|nr:hypothetical protein [bacterium]